MPNPGKKWHNPTGSIEHISHWSRRREALSVLAGKANLANTGSLATTTTEIVQARTTHATSCYHLDFLGAWVVQGKSFFDADTVGDFADGIGGVHGATLTLDNDALENLDTLLIAFDNPNVDLDGIAGAEIRMIDAHLLLIDSFDYCAHKYVSRLK